MSVEPKIKKVAILISGAIGFIASLLAVIAIFTVTLPSYDFYMPCTFTYDDQTKEEQRKSYAEHRHQVQDIAQWASEINGEVAYVSLNVAAGNELNVACDIPSANNDFHLGFWYGGEEDTEEEVSIGLINSFEPLRGPSHSIVELPTSFDPSKSPLHIVDTTGYLFNVDGPFVVEYQFIGGSGGTEVVSFSPVTDTHLWQEIGCAKTRLSYPYWVRDFVPCF